MQSRVKSYPKLCILSAVQAYKINKNIFFYPTHVILFKMRWKPKLYFQARNCSEFYDYSKRKIGVISLFLNKNKLISRFWYRLVSFLRKNCDGLRKWKIYVAASWIYRYTSSILNTWCWKCRFIQFYRSVNSFTSFVKNYLFILPPIYV